MMIFCFFLGACVGSFVFAFYERFCEKKPILSARSHCFSCEKKLKFYHLIPIFSYVFLRGKCGFCGAKISPLSPFCEFFCGVLFVFAFLLTINADFTPFSGDFLPLNNGNLNAHFLNLLNADFTGTLSLINAQNITLDFVFLAFYLSALLLLSLIDIRLKAVPEALLWVSFIFAFCFAVNLRDIYGFLFWGGIDGFVLYAPLFAGFVFLLKSLVSCVLNFKRQNEKLESMGEADILIIASMGGILGFANGFVMIFLACILTFFAFLILKIKEKFTPFFAKNSPQNKEKLTPYFSKNESNFAKNSQEFTPNFSQNKAQNFSENSAFFKQKNDSDFKQNAKIHENFAPNELPFIPFLSAAFLIIFALKDIL